MFFGKRYHIPSLKCHSKENLWKIKQEHLFQFWKPLHVNLLRQVKDLIFQLICYVKKKHILFFSCICVQLCICNMYTCIFKNPFLACEENSVKWYKIFKNPLLIGRWFWIGGRRYWVFSYKVKKKHQREKKNSNTSWSKEHFMYIHKSISESAIYIYISSFINF